MRIGVFDSGIGGVAVANELQKAFPDAHVLVENDHDNIPYGTKSAEKIIELTDAAIRPLLSANCEVIVIACNTATSAAITTLRRTYPNQKFIGLEPMVKPAASLSKSGIIAVFATTATLSSQRYHEAKQIYANSVKVVEPDCSNWAELIEANQLNRRQIDTAANDCVAQGVDVVILGCTHYHWIKDEMKESLAGRAILLEPTDAIVERVRVLLHL